MFKRSILIAMTFLSTLLGNELFTPLGDTSALLQTTRDKISNLENQGNRSLSFVRIAVDDINQSEYMLSFGTQNYWVTHEKSKTKRGKTIWEGRIEGDLWSYVSFIKGEDFLIGTISAENRHFEIRYLGENIVAIIEPRREIKEEDSTKITASAASMVAALGTDDSDTIDVMVIYTTAARIDSGSNAIIEAEIINAIEGYANNALARSCATFRYRVQHMEETAYVELGMAQDLDALRNGTGLLSTVAGLRDTYGADLVQLWTQEKQAGWCGYAYVLTKSYADPANGFGVIVNPASSIASGSGLCDVVSSPHEFGHNMGLSHDRYQERISFDDYSYYKGFGFVDKQHNVGSIMSYQGECFEVSGQYCDYVPYFSNPNIIRDGTVFGKAGIADGIGYMNENSINIARFRNEVNASTPDLSGCMEVSAEGLTSCFVATAAYGSFLDEHVKALRSFRDKVLLPYSWGRSFVAWYYEMSPRYADIIAKDDTLRFIARVILTPIIYTILYPWLLAVVFILGFSLRHYQRRSAV